MSARYQPQRQADENQIEMLRSYARARVLRAPRRHAYAQE